MRLTIDIDAGQAPDASRPVEVAFDVPAGVSAGTVSAGTPSSDGALDGGQPRAELLAAVAAAGGLDGPRSAAWTADGPAGNPADAGPAPA
jgi:hypothetical protein